MQEYISPRNSKEKALLLFAVSFIVFGTFIAASTTVQSVQRYLDGEFTQYDVTCSGE